jgi:hypothetical protein
MTGKSPAVILTRLLRQAAKASVALSPDRSIKSIELLPTHSVVTLCDGTVLHVTAQIQDKPDVLAIRAARNQQRRNDANER